MIGEKCECCGHMDVFHSAGRCYSKKEGTAQYCDCIRFVSSIVKKVGRLTAEEREVLACADYLGVGPELISRITYTYDGAGHFTGLKVIIHIYTGEEKLDWVESHLPTRETVRAKSYIAQRVPENSS